MTRSLWKFVVPAAFVLAGFATVRLVTQARTDTYSARARDRAEFSVLSLPETDTEIPEFRVSFLIEWRGQISACQCRAKDLGDASAQLGVLADLRENSPGHPVMYVGNVFGPSEGEASSMAGRSSALRRSLANSLLDFAEPTVIVPGAVDWSDRPNLHALGKRHRLVSSNLSFDGALDRVVFQSGSLAIRVLGFVIRPPADTLFINPSEKLAAILQEPPSGDERALDLIVLCVDKETSIEQLQPLVRAARRGSVFVLAGVLDDRIRNAVRACALELGGLAISSEPLGQQWLSFAGRMSKGGDDGGWESVSRIESLVRLKESLGQPADHAPLATALDERILALRRRATMLNMYAERITPITNTARRDDRMAKAIAEYKAAVAAMIDEKRKSAATATSSYQGAATCTSCHEEIGRQWASTRHAHAFETLARAGRSDDPQCLQCHTTGFGTDGGFIAKGIAPELSSVQCEICHGPGGKHPEGQSRTSGAPRQVCVTCHDEMNSPRFSLEDYLPRVACKPVRRSEPPK